MSKVKRIQNRKTQAFLDKLPQISLDDADDKLTDRCKFNFHYLSNTPPSATVSVYGATLLEKLRTFSEHSLSHWEATKHSGSANSFYLVYYDSYPTESKTKFAYPKNVPADVRWARFILSGKQRLIGFVVPESKHGQFHPQTGAPFDKNTFYCVFIDLQHQFWLVDKHQ